MRIVCIAPNATEFFDRFYGTGFWQVGKPREIDDPMVVNRLLYHRDVWREVADVPKSERPQSLQELQWVQAIKALEDFEWKDAELLHLLEEENTREKPRKVILERLEKMLDDRTGTTPAATPQT